MWEQTQERPALGKKLRIFTVILKFLAEIVEDLFLGTLWSAQKFLLCVKVWITKGEQENTVPPPLGIKYSQCYLLNKIRDIFMDNMLQNSFT